jgi:hypothetical protein
MSCTQLQLFRPADAVVNGIEKMKAQREKNLKLLESAGWRAIGESVWMVEGCYATLEVWKRKRKGKRGEMQHLDRDTLMPHIVSPLGRHEK